METELQIIAKSVIAEDVKKQSLEDLKRQRNKRRYAVAGVAGAGAVGTAGLAGYAMGAPYRRMARYADTASKVGQRVSGAPTSRTSSSLIRRASRGVSRAGGSTRAGLRDIYHIFDEFQTYVPPLVRKYKDSYKAAPKAARQEFMDEFKTKYHSHLDRFWEDAEYRQGAKDRVKEVKRQRKEVKTTKKPPSALPSGPDIVDETPKPKSSMRRAIKFILRRGK